MPELPEVETSCRGITPYLLHQTITKIVIRQPRLRWPVPAELSELLPGECIQAIRRRGKYIIITTAKGSLLLHLGMSGRVCIVDAQLAPQKHDHIDLILGSGECLRLTDPRRFGCCLWTSDLAERHSLLKNLGPEPLTPDFNADYLYAKAKNRQLAVKLFIMDSKIVVGVGNIYANEALFQAGIDPRTPARAISKARYTTLCALIKEILAAAIKLGGTTLRDFQQSDGSPGYFQQSLNVYGRKGLACKQCKTTLEEVRLGQRSTVFCKQCQQ